MRVRLHASADERDAARPTRLPAYRTQRGTTHRRRARRRQRTGRDETAHTSCLILNDEHTSNWQASTTADPLCPHDPAALTVDRRWHQMNKASAITRLNRTFRRLMRAPICNLRKRIRDHINLFSN
jgi:hypothetical protein